MHMTQASSEQAHPGPLVMAGFFRRTCLANYHQQPVSRCLAYSLFTLLTGLFTFVALACYGLLNPLHATSLSFQSIYAWETALNFGICLFVVDTACGHMKTFWGAFTRRTLGRMWLIWFGAFILAFVVERTAVFWSIRFYAPEYAYHLRTFSDTRPNFVESFCFCLPFWFIILLLLTIMALKHEANLKTVIRRENKKPDDRLETANGQHGNIRIKFGTTVESFCPEKISHISIEDHYARFFLRQGDGLMEVLRPISLNRLMVLLPEDRFQRVHRSHIVNTDHVTRIQKKNRAYEVFLDRLSESLPASRHRIARLLPRLKRFMAARPES